MFGSNIYQRKSGGKSICVANPDKNKIYLYKKEGANMNHEIMSSFSKEIEKNAALPTQAISSLHRSLAGVKPRQGLMSRFGNFFRRPVGPSPATVQKAKAMFPTFVDAASRDPKTGVGKFVHGVGRTAKGVAATGLIGGTAIGAGAMYGAAQNPNPLPMY